MKKLSKAQVRYLVRCQRNPQGAATNNENYKTLHILLSMDLIQLRYVGKYVLTEQGRKYLEDMA